MAENPVNTPAIHSETKLGLKENWQQFSLLVLVNAFVGSMVGLERTVLPLLAEDAFGVASRTAILSFIAAFGVAKALSNLFAGRASDKHGRKRVLVMGWLFGLPVPFVIMFAPSWSWIVAANILLGINQGLAWSSTVIMKIDLVGPKNRGLAMGLNEASGYIAVGLAALASGYIAARYGLGTESFYLGAVIAVVGTLLSITVIRETQGYAILEAKESVNPESEYSFATVFALTSWKNRSLFSASQAGMVNNLNDGMAWGLFPILFLASGFSIGKIGILAATYPVVWGLGQLWTGSLSDSIGRKKLIVTGMQLQAAGIFLMLFVKSFGLLLVAMGLMGIGTACVYPTLIATIGDVAHPNWRATAIGVYRLWRDSGYVVGALLVGLITDLLGTDWALGTVGGLTSLSGIMVLLMMKESLPGGKS